MNKEIMQKNLLFHRFKENLDRFEFDFKDKLIEHFINKYPLEEEPIKEWKYNMTKLWYLVKFNSRFSTIIDLSGIRFLSEEKLNVIHTTSIVVNRSYLRNRFNKANDIKRSMSMFGPEEKVIIIRVIRNKRSSTERYTWDNNTRSYTVLQYKNFFNKDLLNVVVSLKAEGWKIFLIVEGIGLPLLKIIFKTIGIVISGGRNNKKGNLSTNEFNLNRLMLGVFNTSANKIITQSFHDNEKFVNRPYMDLTTKVLDLFIKTIIIDEMSEFCFIYSPLKKYKKLNTENTLLLMEKDIEKINKHMLKNPSKFVEVNKKK